MQSVITKEEFENLPESIQAHLRTEHSEFCALEKKGEMVATRTALTKGVNAKKSNVSAQIKKIDSADSAPTPEEWATKKALLAERKALTTEANAIAKANGVGSKHISAYSTLVEILSLERREFIEKAVGAVTPKTMDANDMVKVVLYKELQKAEKAISA